MSRQTRDAGAKSPRAEVFVNLSKVIAHTGQIDEMLRSAEHVIESSLDVEKCSILVLNADESILTIGASSSVPEEMWPRIQVPRGEGIAGRVLDTGKAELGHVQTESSPTAGNRAGRYKTDYYMCAPMRGSESAIGVVSVTDRRNREPFEESDLELVQALADLTALSIENYHLYNESRESREHMAQLLEDLPIGMFTVTPDDRLNICNKAARRDLDLPTGPTARRHWTDVFPERLHPHVRRALHKVRQGQSSWIDEFEIEDGDSGDVRAVRMSTLEAGGITTLGHSHILFIVEDLNQMREILELRRSDQIKSNFLSLISHELRTPLASVKGAVHLLDQMAPPELREQAERIFAILYRNSERLTRLVNNILDVLDLESESLTLYRKRTDMHELVERVAKRYRDAVKSKKINWALDLNADDPILYADESRLAQVIDHVLENAVKFNPDGGTIHLDSHNNEAGEWVLGVSNTGPPIEKDLHEKIFTKFYQVDASLTRECGGSGLGLYLCREIMRLHGGEILVDPEFAGGARFIMTLPRGKTSED